MFQVELKDFYQIPNSFCCALEDCSLDHGFDEWVLVPFNTTGADQFTAILALVGNTITEDRSKRITVRHRENTRPDTIRVSEIVFFDLARLHLYTVRAVQFYKRIVDHHEKLDRPRLVIPC